MSFQAMTWATAQRLPNAGQKLVLLMLANYCNTHTGQCNPSHKRLAEDCSMAVSTLKTHITALEAAGLLAIIHNAIDGVSLPNQYLLKFEGVGRNPAGGGSDSDGGVGRNPATNQEVEPVIEPTRGARSSTLGLKELVQEGIDESVARDWLAVRKAKKSVLTETAWRAVKREAEIAGLSPSEAIRVSAENGWQGFKASWLQKAAPGRSGQDDIFAGAR